MENFSYEIFYEKIIIRVSDKVCGDSDELLKSPLFYELVNRCIENLKEKNSYLLNIFSKNDINDGDILNLIQTIQYLAKIEAKLIQNLIKEGESFIKDIKLFNEFIEHLYDYWRSFDRFIICESTGSRLDKRPYRTFNATIELLKHLIRKTYRDIEENLTGNHPRIYRQIEAGAEVAAIAIPRDIPYPDNLFNNLNKVPVIRQVLLFPPLILNPPMNRRTGIFERVDVNPLGKINIDASDWLCYPAKVGSLLINIYFNKKFYELGLSLCNLFELADDYDLKKKPDAVYLYGVPGKDAYAFGNSPTVFYDDIKNDILVASVPDDNQFGYFGYLKKMVLTLHNIKMMKIGRLPFHGALVKIILKGGVGKNILIIGDTGAGKSESLEALRILGKNFIQELIIIADDMGSLEIDSNGNIIGYGTEIGAFLRLDDLQPGYAFGCLDRSIIMSPNKINARIVLPVTTFENIVEGHKINYIFYANNYEEIDEGHPVIEIFSSCIDALRVFKEGTVMSKGTTTSTGIVHSYFANIFGPPQYRDLHEDIAGKYFKAFFENGVIVGQIRTRLGIQGFETKGPEAAAENLLSYITGE